MGLFSKKKKAKKADATAGEAKVAAQAAAVPAARTAETIPGEIRIKKSSTNLSGRQRGGGMSGSDNHTRGGGGGRRRRRGRYWRKSRPQSSPPTPSDKSHVSNVSHLTKDTAFPKTPKRRLFEPDPSPLLPSIHGEWEEASGDLLRVSAGVERRTGGAQVSTKIEKKAAAVTKSSTAASKKETAADKKKAKKKGNIWTRSKHFKELTDWAFKTIDADGSGQVDKKELYTGLLMIHLKLATYAGPAACRPATREYCEKIFDRMDVDHSGELDREEFTEVMQIVCAQVFTRVVIQWTMTLMIVPMIAQVIIKVLCIMNDTAWGFWMEIDELDPLRATVSNLCGSIWNKILSFTPGFVQTILGMTIGKVDDLWAKLPEGVRETLPVTLMSCVLGCLLVPYIIYKMDEYHEKRAEKKGKELKKELGIQVQASVKK